MIFERVEFHLFLMALSDLPGTYICIYVHKCTYSHQCQCVVSDEYLQKLWSKCGTKFCVLHLGGKCFQDTLILMRSHANALTDTYTPSWRFWRNCFRGFFAQKIWADPPLASMGPASSMQMRESPNAIYDLTWSSLRYCVPNVRLIDDCFYYLKSNPCLRVYVAQIHVDLSSRFLSFRRDGRKGARWCRVWVSACACAYICDCTWAPNDFQSVAYVRNCCARISVYVGVASIGKRVLLHFFYVHDFFACITFLRVCAFTCRWVGSQRMQMRW